MEEEGAITFYWQTDSPIPGDYTVFVHLIDRAGVEVAQADAPPIGGSWPTRAWVPGQAFADEHVISAFDDLEPGVYSLQVGLYDPIDAGKRLAAFQPDGTRWPNDAIEIKGAIEIP